MLDFSEVGMTQWMFQEASSQMLTLSEAVEQLKQNAHIRTAKETLARYCGIDAENETVLKKRLVELLCQSDLKAKPDSIERKVRMWMKDNVQYIGKKTAIQLCYSLHLQVEEADQMLIRLTGERFHWRDPEDIIWCFGLKNNFSYQQALSLISDMEENSKAFNPGKSEAVLTEVIKLQALPLHTEKELKAFIEKNWEKLGKFHNTAYDLFMNFLQLLGLPESGDFLPAAREMPMKEIVCTYMYKNFVPKAADIKEKHKEMENATLLAIQRDIRDNWPDEIVLSRMMHRQTDVTRKVLILLFLACDGGESKYGDYSDEDKENYFMDALFRITCMLNDCGFAPLDPRIPFDWMVLYCLCADESIFVDNNVQRFLSAIFTDGSSISDEAE